MHRQVNYSIKSLFIILSGSFGQGYAQPALVEVDSLPIVSAGLHKYSLNNQALGVISMKTMKPINITKKLHGGSVLTMFTGISTSSSQVGIWRWPNEMTSSNHSLSWQVPLVFSGEFYKNNERVNNGDGSFSMHTEKELQILWTAPVVGSILMNSDTLSLFEIIRLPSDSLTNFWLARIERREVADNLVQHEITSVTYDFSVKGSFHNKDFMMITSGRDYRSMIFIDNDPVAIFQGHPPGYIKKRDRMQPYILCKRNTSESKDDLMMLGLLNMLLSRCVATDFLH